jgi:hypothetical protein
MIKRINFKPIILILLFLPVFSCNDEKDLKEHSGMCLN